MADEKMIDKPRISPTWAYRKRYARARFGKNIVTSSSPAIPDLPAGTVTFLFTDIVGSVALWEQHPQAMKKAIARHLDILRQAVENNHGVVYKIIGDAIQAAFSMASNGLAAAITAQRILIMEEWEETGPILVRAGIHTGPAEITEGDYDISHTLNRAARVMSAGHGGQILLSQETASLVSHELPVGVSILDLGEHRLKGLTQLEHLYQVVATGLHSRFPPLVTETSTEISQLLLTKVAIPPCKSGLTPRNRLLTQLNTAIQNKLVIISTPAGFGKTTLLVEWINTHHLKLAWLSLDKSDNDPLRFWRYLIFAIQKIHPGVGKTALAALQTTQAPRLDVVALELINDIATCENCILVLDDYHWIQTKEIHDSLNYFIDHIPSQAHLVITTREDPPLQLALRRARREIYELRTSDLRFSNDETLQLLRDTVNLYLDDDDITALHKRTEGWIAGLQMAVLSLSEIDPSERHHFIMEFTGNDRYIVDYLMEEVFQRQSSDIQNFLLKTSILDKMCGPLCDYLTGNDNGQFILNHLERSNIFITPLDTQRGWYRYHSLFSILLQQRLGQTLPKEQIDRLHRQASEWYDQGKMTGEAITHAMAVQDYEYAANLLERNVLEIYFSSEVPLVFSWLKQFPEIILHQHPLLASAYAGASMLVSSMSLESLEEAKRWLDDAETTLSYKQTNITKEIQYTLTFGFIATLRAYISRFEGDDFKMVEDLTQQALMIIPDETLLLRSALWFNLGAVYWTRGDWTQASHAFLKSKEIGLVSGDIFNGISSIYCQVQILIQKGHLYEAAAICREAHHIVVKTSEKIGHVLPISGCIYVNMSYILGEWNELNEAEIQLKKGEDLLNLTTFPAGRILGAVTKARLLMARGMHEQADDLLSSITSGQEPSRSLLQAWKIRVWLTIGFYNPSYLLKAYRWADTCNIDITSSDDFSEEKCALIQILIIRRRNGPVNLLPAYGYLKSILIKAEQWDLKDWIIKIRILQALAYDSENRTAEALATLEEAIKYGEPEGYMRVFIDEGSYMLRLLNLIQARYKRSTYIDNLLNIFASAEVKPKGETYGTASMKLAAIKILSPSTAPLIEPLSNREIEVLQLIADGATNPEIAFSLSISTNTVKKHINSLFGKLNSTSRTQAVRRGQILGLIQ